MDDYALVLNAGSSSLKFCVYRRPEGGAWTLEARGQIEGIGISPKFSATNGVGETLASDSLDSAIRDVPAALENLAPTQRRINDVEFGCLGRDEFRALNGLLERLIQCGDRAVALQNYLQQNGNSEHLLGRQPGTS